MGYFPFSRFDFRVIFLTLALMGMSLLVISSMTYDPTDGESNSFWTPLVKTQLRWFCLGWGVFFTAAFFDYRKLRNWSVLIYILFALMLLGLFFVSPIQNVHRWYRIPKVMSFQPSEQAKLALIFMLSWFLERKGAVVGRLSTGIQMGAIVGLFFLLILKQPDLGTALVLVPIGLVMGYVGGVHRGLLRVGMAFGGAAFFVIALFFLQILPHEEMRPYFTSVMKEYQYERLNPSTYHQKAAQTAIAVGGLTGSGWRKSDFSGKKWLPFAHTDSVFAAIGEEFGVLGLTFLLFLFYALIYVSFQTAVLAKDPFGRLLAAGLGAYIAMHVLLNAAMMCALLPISGVPLILITYGGSSIVTTMAALGLLQSIYSRRFMF
jgi:rod shape determining protein RodA